MMGPILMLIESPENFSPEKIHGTFEDSWIYLASYTADQANASLNKKKTTKQNKTNKKSPLSFKGLSSWATIKQQIPQVNKQKTSLSLLSKTVFIVYLQQACICPAFVLAHV